MAIQTAPCPRTGERVFTLLAGECSGISQLRRALRRAQRHLAQLTTEHKVGPKLDGVINGRSEDITAFSASAALTFLDIDWTRENPAEIIVNPALFAPGTTLSYLGNVYEVAQPIAEDLAANT